MKKCPNCKKTYGDELFFCLDDGSPLKSIRSDADPDSPTEAAFDIGSSLRTEVLPASPPTPKTTIIHNPVSPKLSKLPYVIIALLIFLCGGLAAVLIGTNLDRILPDKQTTVPNVNVPTSPTPIPSTSRNANISPTPPSNTKIATTANLAIGRWRGDWSTESGTLFDFELRLSGVADNGLDGQIRWTMKRSARTDKAHKVGMSATEFVRGTFDPETGNVNLSGYRKDDPNGVLVMLDEYKLKLSANNNSLTGTARNGGKWNGRVSLVRAGAEAR